MYEKSSLKFFASSFIFAYSMIDASFIALSMVALASNLTVSTFSFSSSDFKSWFCDIAVHLESPFHASLLSWSSLMPSSCRWTHGFRTMMMPHFCLRLIVADCTDQGRQGAKWPLSITADFAIVES
jgi:hypothetical protein